MRAMKWFGWALGIALIGGAIAGTPANAQTPPNLSDITGTNIFDSLIVIINRNGLDPNIIDTAERLADEINDAYVECSCNNSAGTGPRRFARGPGDPNVVCENTACDRLYRLLDEARVFLKNVDTAYAEYKRAYQTRAW